MSVFKNKIRYLGWTAALLVLLYMFIPSLGVRGASSIAQGFRSDQEGITAGAFVSLQPDNPNTVELSTPANSSRLLGVVGESALIELSDGGSSVQVVTSGVVLSLVSDINGEVKTGDKITASPVEGVGMKATESGVIAGTAQADLSSVAISRRNITDRNGQEQTIQIGLLPVQVDTIFYSSQEDGSFIPSVIQDLANAVAGGRQVSPVRVLIAALLLLLLFVSIVVLLYSATKSSIISIGRNPLSEGAVHKSLFQVGLTIVGILAFTVILIYLILTI